MILISYGTRPEYIKILPLMKEMKKNNIKYKTLFTGQHKDLVKEKSDFSLSINELSANRLDCIISSCLNINDNIFNNINYIIVQGDTTTALGLAIASFHRKIKVIHLEAGLRSYNIENPYPEELNRKLISSIAELHFCPTKQNKDNLLKENISSKKIHVVGNTAIDNLLNLKDKCSYENKIFITLHRRENHEIIDKWFNEIENLAIKFSDYEFIFPMHPNPNVQKHKQIFNKVKILNPLSHKETLEILTKCKLIITDSGGIQEECSFFNKKCLVCRKTTERVESINDSTFLIKNPIELKKNFIKHIKNYIINYKCPYGDGKTSVKICNILKKIGIK